MSLFTRFLPTKPQVAAISEARSERFFQEALSVLSAQEGIDPLDLQFALEDRGWIRMGEEKDGNLTTDQRKRVVAKARIYALLDPHATATLSTWTNYTLGSGMTFKASDDAVQTLLTTFWKNPKNRTMTSAEGQRKQNKNLLTDGENFYVFFPGDVSPLIRKIDCMEITDFVYDPEDSEVTWAYRRLRQKPDGTTEVIFYRHWAYPDADLSSVLVRDEAGLWGMRDITPLLEEGNPVIYHLPFNCTHKRGNSIFSSSLPWFTAMRQFMEDRISIVKGLAKYIAKLTVKGGKGQMDRIKGSFNAMQKPGGQGVPTLPAGSLPASAVRDTGKTFMQNDSVSLDTMPRTTGAADGRADFKSIRLMFTAGVGMSEPYFGDAESGNLATATAMELPMLKQFEAHQQLWADAWVDMFSIVVAMSKGGTSADTAMELIDVDVDFPPIILKDIDKFVTAITNACAEFPELKQPEILHLTLTTLGLNNVDEIMKNVLKTAAENEKKQLNIAKGMAPDGTVLPPDPTAVVLPAKPARQAVRPNTQPVSIAAAAEAFLAAIEEDIEFTEEALSQE